MASAEEIAKGLLAAIGANDEPATVTQCLDTGYPELNYALANEWDGGMAVGRIGEISGPPAAGKTAIATAVMAHSQKAGGVSGFCDHERSFSFKLAEGIGLDTRPGRFIYKKPETFEQSLQYCISGAEYIRSKSLIAKDAPITWVFDSLASMVPYDNLYDKDGNIKDITKRNMKDQQGLALATSAHLPAFASHCERLGICAIFLNQIRTKPGVVYGDPRYTPGGNSKEFYFSQRMMLSATKVVNKATKEVLGMEVTGVIIKNKVARPFRTATWRFDFMPDGTGRFNRYRSTLDFLVREKILTKSGAYVVWEGKNKLVANLAIELEEANKWDELVKLLPAGYVPPVVAEIDADPAEAA